jgi:hypothetical protein
VNKADAETEAMIGHQPDSFAIIPQAEDFHGEFQIAI